MLLGAFRMLFLFYLDVVRNQMSLLILLISFRGLCFSLNVFLLYIGYFAVDTDSTPEKLVFNRTVTLRDSYSKGGK